MGGLNPAPGVPQWQQQYQQMQADKAQYSQPQQQNPQQIMQMAGLNQPQQSPMLQAYMSMMGGGHFGGIIPQNQGQGMPVFRQPEPATEQKNSTTFGQSPWPGVWGGL